MISARNVIANNVMVGNGSGVSLFDGANHNLVDANEVGGGAVGIEATLETGANTIQRNDVHDVRFGISSSDESFDNVVSDNHVADTFQAISLGLTSNDRVTNNVVRRSATGIKAIGTRGATIGGNRVLRSDTSGIALVNLLDNVSTGTTLVNNLVRRSGEDGILVDPVVAGTTVEGNRALQKG